MLERSERINYLTRLLVNITTTTYSITQIINKFRMIYILLKPVLKIPARHYLSTLYWLAILTMPFSVHAGAEAGSSVSHKRLEKLLNDRIEDYKQRYPEINFLLLRGGDQTVEDIVTLGTVLGKQPANMDYEHPAELREDLVNVSVNRILLMLKSQMPSSSLFKTNKKQYVCVLAISPVTIAANSIQATRHLLDQPLEFIRNIPRQLLLSPEDYLAFAIDHEVYHCLQSMYSGPQPMSQKKLWGEYYQFLNEQAADFYGLGMHIREHGGATAFTRNVQRIRCTSLASADANHFTSKGIQQVLKIPAREFINADVSEVFAKARYFREREVIDYDTYIQYVASAIEAMKVLGLSSLITEELQISIVEISPDPSQVNELVSHTRQCLAELAGKKFD